MIIDQLADIQIVIHGKETSIPDIDETMIDSMKVGELKTLYPYIDSLIFTYTYGQYTLSNEDMRTLHRIKNTIKSTIIRKQEAILIRDRAVINREGRIKCYQYSRKDSQY